MNGSCAQGYTILSAGTLREAGKVLKEVAPDVIVLDIELPDGSGFAFLTKPCDVEELQRAVTDGMDRKAGVFA